MDIVSALLAALADRVGKERFELWFGPRTRIEWDGHVLTIGAPNQFFLDWIRANFRTAVEEACLAILGRRPPLEFRVEVAGQRRMRPMRGRRAGKPPAACQPSAAIRSEAMVSFNGNGKHDATASGVRTTAGGLASRRSVVSRQRSQVQRQWFRSTARANTMRRGRRKWAQRPHACRVAKQAEPPPTPAFSPRKFASLSSFVVGASNRLAMYSAEMVARNPGQITPLFVYGPTSVGKTHLLEGIWSAERKAGRGTTTVYLSAEQFTSQFLEALRGGGLPVFRRKYRGVHVLILDDLQFLAGKRATQVELMHTVDTLLRDGRQLVFAADRPPVELSDFMPELITRLTGGMVCRIEPPDYTTRLGIVGLFVAAFGDRIACRRAAVRGRRG